MLYTKLNDKTAKCKNVRIESNIAEELLSDVKKLAKAGVIKVVFVEEYSEIAHDIQALLQKQGYNADKIAFSDSVCFEELSENSEGIILLGGELGKYFDGKKCIIVSELLDMSHLLHKEYHTVLADFSQIRKAEFDYIASCYGVLSTKLLACFDFRVSSFCFCKSPDFAVVEQIERCIKEVFAKSYSYFRDDVFLRDLLTCGLNIGLLESMLDNENLLSGYDLASSVVKKIAKSNKLEGEYAMLVGWFGFCTAQSLVKCRESNLFYPCDIMADLDFVSENSVRSRLQLLQIASTITAKEYTRFGFILNEYSSEINKYLKDIFPTLQNAMKNFRRIYYDVGAEISSSISLLDLSQSILKSVIFNPNYSYLKTMRVLGAV